MENSNNSGKVILAFLAGTAIGAALGILFAPEKGSKTREQIMGRTEDLKESLRDKFNELLEEAKDEFAAAKGEAADYVEKARKKTL